MTVDQVAESGWVVRVTVIEDEGKPTYHYFLRPECIPAAAACRDTCSLSGEGGAA